MKYKLIKEIVAIIGAFVIMTNCMTTAFAVNANVEESSEINAHTTVYNIQDEFRPGAVLVSFNQGAIPSVDKLLPGFEIVCNRYISPNICMITFTDKSTDAVLKAIEILNASPYIKCAEPDYYMSIQPVIKSTSEPTETSQSDMQSNTEELVQPLKGDADGDGRLTIKDATWWWNK